MTFWEVLGQGAVALYSLITLALVTLLVARTSKRVLGIQVSAIRAMLVVIGIFAMLGPVLVVYFGEHTGSGGHLGVQYGRRDRADGRPAT